MIEQPASMNFHRVQADDPRSVVLGTVHFAPLKTVWLTAMAVGAAVGGAMTFSIAALSVFIVLTAGVLLFGHSLGSHRKLIHDSYQCPKWLEYFMVWCGVQVGLAGPLGLLRQHELRDYAQRLPACHDYLRHGSSFWRDAWWQLCCELRLDRPPSMTLEPRIADDRFYRFLERTWMLQQLPPALLLHAFGGWAFVFWGTCARVSAGVVGHWLIGYFAHNDGGMHYEVRGAAVQGRNIKFSALLTMGESWHNNHHAFPGSARLGLFAGEWDPGWWALTVLRKAGLVWDLRLPSGLPARAELRACDALGAIGPDDGIPPEPLRLRDALASCLGASALAHRHALALAGPAATLSPLSFGRLTGGVIPFRVDAGARRVTLQIGALRLRGLPALCGSLCARGPVWRSIGLALLPLAWSFESVRERLHVG